MGEMDEKLKKRWKGVKQTPNFRDLTNGWYLRYKRMFEKHLLKFETIAYKMYFFPVLIIEEFVKDAHIFCNGVTKT